MKSIKRRKHQKERRKYYELLRPERLHLEDMTQRRQIKDSNGIVIAEENEIKRRWETYFEGLLNEENPRTVFEGVTRREEELAVKMIKNSKAAGPHDIPVEVWKSLRKEGIDIPIYKGKGDIQECGNYRGIKLINNTKNI
ncbi:uncharacterized protein [Palaemon carinicauda]|uniref:uncharacterized protein n=1 Tax=Palaemon carinicauda TaxID=392227 RepID=UPI0035B6852D